MLYFLQLGDWETLLYACTPDAEDCVRQFWDLLSAPLFSAPGSGKEYQHLVVASPSVPDKKTPPKWLPKSVHLSWTRFHEAWTIAYKRFCHTRSLVSSTQAEQHNSFIFSWPRSGYSNIDILSFSPQREKSIQFFALVIRKPNKYSHLKILVYNLLLATWWHVLRGGLCLHSTAVARERDGFLFLGGSKAGKTSVAQLSASIGHSALGDDLNFVIRDEEHNYTLAAAPSPQPSPVGYSALRPPLKGVFTLVKDYNEYLVPMSPMLTARALFDGFMQTPSVKRLPYEAVGLAFSTACEIARKVPGYELHFRKSPNFWDVIDAELEK